MSLTDLDKTYLAHTYNRFPAELVRAEGALLYDTGGKEYIDLGAGIAVSTFGAADPEWADAVSAQAHTLAHASNLYYTEPCVRLAQTLCERTGMKRVFFSNSGAEANECAVKCARRYAYRTYGDESHANIITLKHSFHGRTLATLAATGQSAFHTEFGPFPGGFLYADPDDPASLETLACTNGCAAVMFECVQGEGGVRTLSGEMISAIKTVCERHGLLMIVDEVQTGNGRTGTLYCYEQFGLSPDIVTTAKGLAGGLPLGATLFGERTAEVYTPGSHGSTFGGNPIACAGACSILSRIDDALLAGVRAKGAYIRAQLADTEVTGLGLMVGITVNRPAKEIADECLSRGLLVLTAKDKVRLLPPLNIPDEQLARGIQILKEVIAR